MSTIKCIQGLKHFVTERARTSRRFIKLCQPPHPIDSLNIIEIQKDSVEHLKQVIHWLNEGCDVGLLSESGMPSIADPGSDIVKAVHRKGGTVVPHVGPSSILLALGASGFNGQNFRFNGYLPIKQPQLKDKLRELEKRVIAHNETQIFIETPYRNDKLIQTLISQLPKNLSLCIARDLTGVQEMILCSSVADLVKKGPPQIGKLPCIFLIGK